MQSSSESTPFSSPSEFVQAPETALGVIHATEFKAENQDHLESSVSLIQDLSNPILSYPESATGGVPVLDMLDHNLKASLQTFVASKESLPKTLSQAMQDDRPIVVTKAKAPFVVHDVNSAWEGLCGFKHHEARDRSVGELLGGPETDNQLAMHLVRSLKHNDFAEGTLTNYKKDGQAFTNHLQLGVVHDDGGELFFVGVLEEIDRPAEKAATAM